MKQIQIHVVALAVCPRCKSEVTEIADSGRCEPCEKEVRENRNANRRERDQFRRDMGLTRVRGNLGGVYWE